MSLSSRRKDADPWKTAADSACEPSCPRTWVDPVRSRSVRAHREALVVIRVTVASTPDRHVLLARSWCAHMCAVPGGSCTAETERLELGSVVELHPEACVLAACAPGARAPARQRPDRGHRRERTASIQAAQASEDADRPSQAPRARRRRAPPRAHRPPAGTPRSKAALRKPIRVLERAVGGLDALRAIALRSSSLFEPPREVASSSTRSSRSPVTSTARRTLGALPLTMIGIVDRAWLLPRPSPHPLSSCGRQKRQPL